MQTTITNVSKLSATVKFEDGSEKELEPGKKVTGNISNISEIRNQIIIGQNLTEIR